jgi:hypothetical protein
MTQRVRVLLLLSVLVLGGCSDESEAAATCPDFDGVSGLAWSLSGAWNSRYQRSQYNGWAVVERSTRNDLVLYVSPKRLALWSHALSATSDDSEAGGNHAVLTDERRALPVLPIGHRVWLTSYSDRFVAARPGAPPPPRSGGGQITLRAQAKGTVLLSSVERPMLGALNGDVVGFAAPTELCSRASGSCRANGRDVYYELIVQADRPLSVRHGESAEVAIGGSPYTMYLQRAQNELGDASEACAAPDARIWLSADIRPGDVLAFEVALEPSTLPACVCGNDPALGVVSDSLAEIHGEVVLSSKRLGSWQLDAADGRSFELSDSAPITARVGDRFWLDLAQRAFVLRTSRAGAVLLAGARDDTSGQSVARLGEWLGVEASLEAACLYERSNGDPSSPGTNELYDLLLDDTRIGAGRSASIELGAVAYRVWSSGVGPDVTVMIAR